MKIIEHVLENDTLNSLHTRVEQISKESLFVSSLRWKERIRVNCIGNCFVREITSEDCGRAIIMDLKDKLPVCQKISVLVYLWDRLSAISWHNDGNHKVAGTIYLNKEWHINHGGVLVWGDQSEILSAYVPKYNTMSLNENHTYHMITPVGLDIPELRTTIQIFGD
jgi:hypothetical protein